MYEDSSREMAKATYAPMFETVSGALNKIDKKSPHAADQKMVLATHRKAPTTSPDCSRVYLRFKAQKDTANGKKTMRSYLWSLESAAYDAQNG